jgi:hypothetical protein
MNQVLQHNIGGLIVVVTSIAAQSASAGTINGNSVDRFLHNMPGSAVLHSGLGAISGAPSASSVTTKLQHSSDNSTWTDFKPDGANVALLAPLTAANTEGSLNVDLSLANRYIRAVSTVAFTGGTTPSLLTVAEIVMAGAPIGPAI